MPKDQTWVVPTQNRKSDQFMLKRKASPMSEKQFKEMSATKQILA